VPTQLETHQHLSIPNLNKTVASISPAVHPLHWKMFSSKPIRTLQLTRMLEDEDSRNSRVKYRKTDSGGERGFETDRDEIGEGEKRAARWV
jgi:hypothetical protein